MAGKRKPTDNDAEIEREIDEIEIDDVGLELSTLIGEIGSDSDARLFIYRIPKDGPMQKWAYVDECDPSAFNVAWLKATHGPGRYRLQVRVNGAIQFSKEVIIDGTPTANVPGGNTDLARILQMSQENSEKMLQRISDMYNANKSPVQKIMTPEVLIALLTAAPALLSAFKEFLTPNSASRTELSEMLAVLKQGIELGKMGGEKEESGTGFLKEMAQAIMPALTSAAMQNQQTQNPRQLSAPQPTAPGNDQMKAFIARQMLNPLIEAAEKNTDVNAVAEYVLDNVPPKLLDEILAADDPIAVLAAWHPDAEKHRIYFSRLLPVLTEATADPDNDAEPDGSQGNPSNAVSSETPDH